MSRSILAPYFDKKTKYFDTLIDLFDGTHREWQICFSRKEKKYTKPFFVESGETIVEQSQFKELHKFEVSFSVQTFENPDCTSKIDWTFIIDIDKIALTKRVLVYHKIIKLLDQFDLIYFVDGRLHIWFPPWTHSYIDSWNSFYNKDFASYMKYFLEVVCNIKHQSEIDSGLWYWTKHKIRCPYTFHIETNKLQIFYDKELKPINFNRVKELWNGSCFSITEIESYCNNFKRFINQAIKIGKTLFDGFNLGYKKSPSIKVKNFKIRPCFKQALNNVFIDKNITHIPHLMRLAIISEAVCAGIKEPKEIAELFKKQNDYSYSKSLYYVTKALQTATFIKPWHCTTIQKYNWCIKERCERY